MTREKLSKTLDYWREGLISKNKAMELIFGQPFEGQTEKINTAKSVSAASPIPQTDKMTTPEPSKKIIAPNKDLERYLSRL